MRYNLVPFHLAEFVVSLPCPVDSTDEILGIKVLIINLPLFDPSRIVGSSAMERVGPTVESSFGSNQIPKLFGEKIMASFDYNIDDPIT